MSSRRRTRGEHSARGFCTLRRVGRSARIHGERRDQIVVAARREFAHRGYHATQVSHIVRRAGIARGTFYYHYAGKRQVFDDVLERILAIVDASLGVIDPSRPVRPQVVGNIAGLVRVLVDNLDLARILLHVASGLDELADSRLTAFWDRLIGRVEETVREGQRIGYLRDGDPSVMAMALVGTVKELIYQHLLGSRRLPVALAVREAVRFALDGVERR